MPRQKTMPELRADFKLNPEQLRMARHALGLPNKISQTYRNRYFCEATSPKGFLWLEMVSRGLAGIEPEPRHACDFFWLTRAGAEMALDLGERLDPEDFPEAGK